MRKGQQPPWIVPDGLWERIEPLLPVKPRSSCYLGRRPLPDRKVLCGILFVLHTGIQWEFLPQELGFGSGMTCWRRLEAWQAAGVWQQLHELLLAELRGADQLDWSKAVVDSSHLRAMKGGPKRGPSPVDRAKTGSKHHVITDGAGIPLAAILTGGNRHDITQLLELVDAIPPVRGKVGRPKRRPDAVYADRAYDSEPHREALEDLGIVTHLARKGTDHGSGLGKIRWVVEQTVALLHWFRRLRIRWEIRDDIHEAFLSIACSLICYRRLTK